MKEVNERKGWFGVEREADPGFRNLTALSTPFLLGRPKYLLVTLTSLTHIWK